MNILGYYINDNETEKSYMNAFNKIEMGIIHSLLNTFEIELHIWIVKNDIIRKKVSSTS